MTSPVASSREPKAESREPLLSVRNLTKHFERKRLFGGGDTVRAVDGVSLDVFPGETLALVGESGSGKTTTGRAILRLIEPDAGEVTFDGHNVLTMPPTPLRKLRRKMQIVFQDPYSSLNPRMTVGAIVGEPLAIHKIARGRERDDRVAHLLEVVGLDPRYVKRYPHEFSDRKSVV